MRGRAANILAVALLLAACGGDGAFTTGTFAPGTTTTPLPEVSTTTAVPTTTTVAPTTTWSPPADAGLAWARVPDEAGIWAGAGDQFIFSLVAAGPGLVAAGIDASGGDGDAAVWVSKDGLSWDRVAAQAALGGAGDQWISSVTAGGPGLVAAGGEYADEDEDAAVWVSADGYVWTRILDDAVFGGDGGQGLESVVAGGPGLVAGGYDYSDGEGNAAVWVSADGYAWTRVEDEPGLGAAGEEWMEAITVGGPGLVAVGIDHTDVGQDGAVWVSVDGYVWTRIEDDATFGGENHQQIRSVAAGGPGVVAVGSTRLSPTDTDVVVWVSIDGYAWTRLEGEAALGGEGSQWCYQVVDAGSRLVIVGVDAAADDGEGGVWVSDDGYSWARIADVALGGAGDQWIEAISVGGPGLVAAGWDGSGGDPDAAVWVSPPPE